MKSSALTLHPGLSANSRLHGLISQRDTPQSRELVLLIGIGGFAAVLTTFLDFSLRIPGHAILRSVLPMTFGLALVPRRGAGAVMGVTAFLTAFSLRLTGFAGASIGLGALTSLTATGPLLDLTLRYAQGGWKQYAAFGVAGVGSNLLALIVRGTAKFSGWEQVGKRPLAAWLPQASLTYVLCGFVAGLLCGGLLFAGRNSTPPSEPTE